MKIVIYTTEPFPIGYAATNRILSYCYGFLNNDVSVLVITTSSKVKSLKRVKHIFGNDRRLKCVGIPFIQTKVTRRIHKWLLYLLYPIILEILLSRAKYDAIIFYGNDSFHERLAVDSKDRHNIPVVKEESEYPYMRFPFRCDEETVDAKNAAVLKKYDSYSGVLSMTNPIRDYLLKVGINSEKVEIIPHTVIWKRFEYSHAQDRTRFREYILYTGSFSNHKDGTLNLIEAFDIVHSSHPEIGIVLAGFGSLQQHKELLDRVHFLGLSTCVQIIKNVPNTMVPNLICNAKVLVSPRPYSVQAEFGFPTKVVEYLASGKPVVTTAYGDLSDYIEDKKNAFMVIDSQPLSIAEAILYVLDNYDEASAVAKNGADLVKRCFDPKINTQLIIDYMKKLTQD